MFTRSVVTEDFQSGLLHPANSQRPAVRPQSSFWMAAEMYRVTSQAPGKAPSATADVLVPRQNCIRHQECSPFRGPHRARRFYAREVLVVRKTLEVAGQSGTLTAITATHAVLNGDGRDMIIASSSFLEQTSKQ